jgi:hypothetical protein
MRRVRKCCEATLVASSRSKDASRHFLDSSATLLAVMQGGEYACPKHLAIMFTALITTRFC